MPKIIEEFSKSTAGRPESYPWAEWLDGQKRAFVRGTEDEVKEGNADFACTPASFIGTARKAADKRGLRISSVNLPDGVVELSAVPPKGEADEGDTPQPEDVVGADEES